MKDSEILRLGKMLQPVFPELNDIKLMKGSSSYTINKYKIYICLRDRKTNVIYTDNMLVYVILHELAHTLCDEIGHTKKFIYIFKNLLHRAIRYNLYDPDIPTVKNYCS